MSGGKWRSEVALPTVPLNYRGQANRERAKGLYLAHSETRGLIAVTVCPSDSVSNNSASRNVCLRVRENVLRTHDCPILCHIYCDTWNDLFDKQC